MGKFLVWNTSVDATASLAALHVLLGTPYTDEATGYVMEKWDDLSEADSGTQWGFWKPEGTILGCSESAMNAVMVGSYSEHDGKPAGWDGEI